MEKPAATVVAVTSTPAAASVAARSTNPGANPGANVLVVFDYDWSLVNENSDTFIFRELHAPLIDVLNARLATRVASDSWTALMDELLSELATQQPELTATQIRATLARIPVLDRMLDAVRLAATTHGADVKIVSDANTVYIESMLAHHGIDTLVSEVVTNPGVFERDAAAATERHRLRVTPFHALALVPHGCSDCPANMCKGAIVDRMRHERTYTHVLYVGDGPGDFCPATRLAVNDVVFARANDAATNKSFGLLKRLRAHPTRVQARVVPWTTGDDIYDGFESFFQSLYTTSD